MIGTRQVDPVELSVELSSPPLEPPNKSPRAPRPAAGRVEGLEVGQGPGLAPLGGEEIPLPLAQSLGDGNHEGRLGDGGEEGQEGVERDVHGESLQPLAIVRGQDSDDD